MTVAQLRAELKNRGLDTTGLKVALAARLQAARRSAGNSAHADGSLKRKRDPTTAAVVPTTVRYLQRGAISILDAVAEEIPDVFTEHILPQLDLDDTLRLAQVNKAYNDVVWSADGVRSLNKKINAQAKYCGETRTTPMYWAVKHGNLPAVRAILKSWDVNWIIDTFDDDSDEYTALHYAANPQANPKPNPKVVKALIEAGANVNVQDYGGDTPLILAISPTFDHPDPHLAITPRANVPNIIELIKAGADVNLANKLGDTPLHVAVHNAQETCVALLIQAGADVHKVDHNGESPMELAVRRLASWKKSLEEATNKTKNIVSTRVSMHENIVYLLRYYAGAK